jgi:hypothetical protein
MASAATKTVRIEHVAARIHVIRGENVMLDADLAEMYGVRTKNLNLAVRRNLRRFPADFMFQLSPDESTSLRLQIATSNTRRGGRRYAPYAFTEQGVAMLSSVLRGACAADVNIAIMRTFVKVRRILATNGDLARQVAQHDLEIATLFTHVQKLLTPCAPKKAPAASPRRSKTRKARTGSGTVHGTVTW